MTDKPRYSLWLLPAKAARERYAKLIRELSTRLATPVFEPHVTLLGELTGPVPELAARLRALAEELAPFELRLLEATYLDEYFRALFVEVALSRPLTEAHAAARQHFGRRLDPGYYPHLSLVYGDLENDQKEALLEDVGRYYDESVRVEEIALYTTAGSPQTWRCVARARLEGKGR